MQVSGERPEIIAASSTRSGGRSALARGERAVYRPRVMALFARAKLRPWALVLAVIAHGKYAVRIHRDRAEQNAAFTIIRFWLDHRFAHDIADASGFFHVEAVGEKTRLTYLVMVDLGAGVFGQMFEGRIRRAALSTPLLVKRYVESQKVKSPS
jgi:hypothetical protein